MRARTMLVLLAASLGVAFWTDRTAFAAPPWVDRPLTLPGGDWAFDFGMGVEHVPDPVDNTVGVNAEMAVGLTNRVELGVRTGLRLGDFDSRVYDADFYGRLFDRQTLAVGAEGAEVLANPEVRIRGALVREEIVELALEGRVVLPFANDTDAGMLFGMPMAFHLGNRVRLDVGVYVPVIFFPNNAQAALSVPVDVWIQATRRLWLGPMTGVVFNGLANSNCGAPGAPRLPCGSGSVSLGFGLGYQITRALDLKGMLLFPDINDDSRDFGFGVGFQVRIE